MLSQILAFKKDGIVSKQMVKFMADAPKESWVEVAGEIQVPKDQAGSRVPITGTSQQVHTFCAAYSLAFLSCC